MDARRLLRLAGITLAAFTLLGTVSAPAAPIKFSAPVRLGFQAGDDWEPSIAADRFGHMYALWNHYGDDPYCPDCPSPHMEIQISSDGGRTWSNPRPLVPDATTRQDDPQIVVDPVDGSTVYAGFMMGDKSSQYVARSTDFGATWTPVLVEPLQRGTDKDILAVRGQDVYLVYNAVMKIYASVSHDGGQTWATYQIVANTNSKLGWSLPFGGAVDSKGNAYFAWAGYEGNGKPSGNVNLFVSKSSDGGKTWTTSLIDVSGPPPPCNCGGWAYWGAQMALTVDGMDRVYVLYNAGPSKYAVSRVFFRGSGDGGATWSPRQDVSFSPVGANNLFPAIVARGDGDVRIAWMDDRNGFDTGSGDPNARWNVFYRASTDAGATWSSETQLSRYVSGYPYDFATPKDGFLQPYGDYFELDIDGKGTTQAIWGEGPSYWGPGNVWYAHG